MSPLHVIGTNSSRREQHAPGSDVAQNGPVQPGNAGHTVYIVPFTQVRFMGTL